MQTKTLSPLFHYTDFTGLKGIIEKDALWLTHYKCMTDFMEFRHSGDILKKEIETILLQKYPQLDQSNPGHSYLLEGECSRIYKILVEDKFQGYLSCFCMHEDDQHKDNGLLSMWRSYGQKGGFALVFNRNFLNDEYLPQGNGYVHGDVHYPNEGLVLSSDLEKYLQQFRSFLQKNKSNLPELVSIDVNSDDLEAIAFLIALIKDVGFKEESEFRLCIFEKANSYLPEDERVYPKLREGFISYLEFPMHLKSTLEKIIIGPQDDMNTKKNMLKKFLQSKDLDHVVVKESTIPYLPR